MFFGLNPTQSRIILIISSQRAIILYTPEPEIRGEFFFNEISNPIFWEKYFKMSSAVIFT